MQTLADYAFLGAVMIPPLALAIGFLIVVSPGALARAERSERAEPTRNATAKAH
jgi:hypothetical protein